MGCRTGSRLSYWSEFQMALDGQAPPAHLGREALEESEAQILPEHHPEVLRLSCACHGHSPSLPSFLPPDFESQ